MIKNINQFIKSRKFEYLLLSLVILLGLLVRLYKIGNPIADWHSWRQADTASVTKIYAEKGINLLLPRYHDISSIQTGKSNLEGFRMVEFPIYNAIGAILSTTFKFISLEVWSRLLTIFSALITAFFLYLLGKKYLGSAGGLLSAFFYLFIPFNIYFTRVILPDPMGVMFGVVALFLFVKFIDSGKNITLYLSAVFFALMLLIKPYPGFYLIPAAYLAIDKFGIKNIFKDKKILINLLIFLGISIVPFLLWRAWESKFPEAIPFYTWAFNGNHIRFKPSFWYWIFGERLGHLILGSLGLIPFTFGILNTKVKNYFIHWFLGGALIYVILVASANTMHDYYQILVIPAISLALSAGSVYLWTQNVFNKTLSRIVLIFSVGVMFITGWNQISGNYNINHPEIIEAGSEIDVITPKDSLIVAPYSGDTAFLYQTGRSGWPAIDDSIDNIIEKGADYYVSIDLASPDTKMIEARFKTIKLTGKYVIIDLGKPLNK
jgi:hypothetical protein